MNQKLWGGRFQADTDESVDDFNSSIAFDQRLFEYDIQGSVAHVRMLGRQGIVSKEEADVIETALNDILNEIKAGKVDFSVDAEDIHMNIETLLIQKIGDVGKKVHTARSRNDQVALDVRMFCKAEILEIQSLLKTLLKTLLTLCKDHKKTILSGYTHLQKAQPITLSHYFMAYVEMFKRDHMRLFDCHKRTNIMPLGSCALAGTTYPLDRDFVAGQLGFSGVTLNSLDGVSDRDFVVELVSAISLIMVHLSRISEEFILWASQEYHYITLDDRFSTGSSIMPQKKNPDIAELVRGKNGRVFGDLIALLTMLKGLPLAYNKDMQEDKESLFDAVDTVKMCLNVFEKMLATTTFNKEIMARSAKLGFTNATDAADYLVKKGVPFRTAHDICGRLVHYCLSQEKTLEELSLDEFKTFSPLFESDIYQAIDLEVCVEKRLVIGSPSSAAMDMVIKLNEDMINGL